MCFLVHICPDASLSFVIAVLNTYAMPIDFRLLRV